MTTIISQVSPSLSPVILDMMSRAPSLMKDGSADTRHTFQPRRVPRRYRLWDNFTPDVRRIHGRMAATRQFNLISFNTILLSFDLYRCRLTDDMRMLMPSRLPRHIYHDTRCRVKVTASFHAEDTTQFPEFIWNFATFDATQHFDMIILPAARQRAYALMIPLPIRACSRDASKFYQCPHWSNVLTLLSWSHWLHFRRHYDMYFIIFPRAISPATYRASATFTTMHVPSRLAISQQPDSHLGPPRWINTAFKEHTLPLIDILYNWLPLWHLIIVWEISFEPLPADATGMIRRPLHDAVHAVRHHAFSQYHDGFLMVVERRIAFLCRRDIYTLSPRFHYFHAIWIPPRHWDIIDWSAHAGCIFITSLFPSAAYLPFSYLKVMLREYFATVIYNTTIDISCKSLPR